MKLATRLLSPLLILGLAACGSADKPSSTERSGGRADAALPSGQQAKSTPAAKSATGAGKGAKPGSAATTPGSGSGAKSAAPQTSQADKKAPATPHSPALTLPKYSTYQLSASSAYPLVGVVAAGARFQLTFTSTDGRPHLVKLATPKPRTIRVQGGDAPVRIVLPGVKPGNYSLDVDGRRAVSTLAVMDPKQFGKPGKIPSGAKG